ncbi:hypothetical protein XH94_23140 [Bradyrhizobium zhanjiangense]|uniref:Condensation domain-containing protein n=1 Tax=Bradyrhizobium zhanjiangense TaxID=1325107 RepID=A0A4Q0SKE2_9BRAD|nr:hypothetical protein XH94_23140 [Bradyrhizobium zhanjiangense]
MGKVVARSSGREQVVFGTVLFGHAWRRRCRRTMGLFINTMPLRLDKPAHHTCPPARAARA